LAGFQGIAEFHRIAEHPHCHDWCRADLSAIVHFFRTIGVPLIEVYGLTESSGIALGQVLSDRRSGQSAMASP
jgi:hypothetical protein